MKYALINSENIVVNLVEYDGKSKYEPEKGLNLCEVNNWICIGHDVNTCEPEYTPEHIPSIDEIKAQRNEEKKKDLPIVACYFAQKRENRDLKFSDYLDELELLAKQI